jgi:CRP/FNR family transcriptional regulator, cyclic AMP receptor protein
MQLCWVLEEDPDLAQGMSPTAVRDAREHAIAPLVEVVVGEWDPGRALAEVRASGGRGPHGLVMLDGVFMRELTTGSAVGSVLVGAGDVIWEPKIDDAEFVPRAARWTALTDVRLAVIDAGFLRRIAPWPQITLALLERAARQSEMLALQQTIGCQVRVEDRVLMLLLALAERWGRVLKAGIRLDLPITVTALAELVAAHRQSVSAAVARLGRQGLIERSAHGWLVHGHAPEELRRLATRRADARTEAAQRGGAAGS